MYAINPWQYEHGVCTYSKVDVSTTVLSINCIPWQRHEPKPEVNVDLVVYGYLPFYRVERQIGQTPN